MYSVLLFLHFIGWAILIGGLIAAFAAGISHHRHFGVSLAGALTALVTGFALMFVHNPNVVEAGAEAAARGFDTKMLWKILLTLAITALLFWAWHTARRAFDQRNADGTVLDGGDPGAALAAGVGTWLKFLIAALAILTIALSIFWR